MRLLLVLALISVPEGALAQELRAIHLPDGGASAEAGTTAEELSLVRLGVAHAGRRIPTGERPGLAATMEVAYARMHERVGAQPSVLAASHSVPQTAGSFDALIGEPARARFGVVFLHGYGGNFTWPCHAVAEVVMAEGGAILCPSQGSSGRWGEGEGPGIADAAIRALEARGIRRIVLAGLSSGGVGASRLLARFDDRLVGAVLLSGARPVRTALPVLLVHGTRDRMIGVGAARAFVRRSPSSTLVTLDSGHFVLAEQTATVQAHLRRFLRDRALVGA
jgi:pimeloyl-ACP methyl ester carboxylesterase